jgi:hypothetical protein
VTAGQRLSIAVLLLVVMTSLTGCSLFPGAKRLGVSASPSGGVRVHFVPCPGEVVTKVAYLEGVGGGFSAETGNDQPADDPDDDEILRWLAVAPSGSEERTFDIGVTPPGFAEELPLDQDPRTVSAPAAFVAYRGREIGSLEIGFDVDDLERGSILTLGGRKDPATFEREALESC